MNWLQFLSHLVDHKKTFDIFVNYFNQNPELILQIFKSVTHQNLQKDGYCSIFINFFTKLLSIGEIGIFLLQLSLKYTIKPDQN